MNKIKAAILLSLGINSGVGLMAYGQGVSFEHKDWQVVCDNTRTCRAAGYSSEDAKNRVTVLFTRKAGVGQEVSARVRFSEISEDDKNADIPDQVILKIDNKSYGEVQSSSTKDLNDDSSSVYLSTTQIKALLVALKRTSKISFVGGNEEWILPGDGAAAVLLKMDDVQGRIGTPSALIRKGTKSEDSVLPALPTPVVYQKSLPKGDVTSWQSKISWDTLKKELPSGKELVDDNYCGLLTEGDNDYNKFDPKVVAVLPQNRLLVSGLCWQGAYNEGYGYWIINQKQPHNPKLVTTMADGVVDNDLLRDSQLLSSMKGRGVGDCWSRRSWVWNGKDFVKTYEGGSGMCRMIAAGGAWNLPTYIATVK